MPISSLHIADFRNLAAVEMAPCARGLNILCGDNGSGKTSLLEAIHYLGLGRSFRSSSSARLIRHGADKFSVVTQLVSDGERGMAAGVQRDIRGDTRIRLAEKEISGVTELAYFLPIRLINSQSHHLFESGPTYRRKYLDWGLFYQSPTFLTCWRQFERVLKQRNAVLRERLPKTELNVWTDELIKYGLAFDQLRREYVQAVAPLIIEVIQELLPIAAGLDISYKPGWDEHSEYADVLAMASYHEECRLGHTQYGPHRADLEMSIEGISVKHFLSRGQQKLLICAMLLAQGMLLAKSANKGVNNGLIYLVDDLPSELDLQSRQKLVSLLSKQQTQVFITAIDSEILSDFSDQKLEVPMKVFHVEHGRITEQPSAVSADYAVNL